MPDKTTYATIDEYIAGVPASDDARERMRTLRALVHKLAPGVQERMSWSMPTFYLNGNLVHFAVQKNHLGFYPGAEGVAHFADALEGYKTSKGAIQFPYSQPLPLELIENIIRFRVEQNTR